MLSISGAQQKAFVLATLLAISATAFAATSPNMQITNTAMATYQIGLGPTAATLSTTGTATLNTSACVSIGVKIELLQYIPPARAALAPISARVEKVQPSAYAPGGSPAGPYIPLPAPTMLGDTTSTALPANLLLAPLNDARGKPISVYARNEPIFLRVLSYDANINPNVADTVSVTLTTSNGDNEVVQLTETGPSTGVFVGAVPSVFSAITITPVANDGKITFSAHNETMTGVYNHADCTTGAAIANSSSVLIDPYGVVFDSITGASINGATVSLISTLTGLPATVYCDDAVTVLPQPLISGSPTNCDSTMIAGGFRFPQVAAGGYKLIVIPPQGYAFPSNVLASNLPATMGNPSDTPVILGNPGLTPGGSYGGVFSLTGPTLHVDIPVDSGAMAVTIQKSADKAAVGTGEFAPYTLTITNNNPTLPLAGAQIADHPPQGFRYQKGSARLNGFPMPDPLISADARTITFNLNIAAASVAMLRYVMEVTPGAHTGMAINTATAIGGLTSNTARASVLVTEDLYRNKTILIGRVIDGSCDDKAESDAKGLANARIVLEDGTYVLTDREGRWHIDNLRAGTHVVQLDMDSLPQDYEVVACEKNSRFAGRNYSQFVNLRGGSLWRADFHVQKKALDPPRITQALAAKPANDKNIVSLTLVSNTAVTGYSATLLLPEFSKYIPGSAQLNGAPISDPDSIGHALIFRSKTHAANWQDQYSVEVEDIPPNATIKSLVRFTPPHRAAQNLPVAQLTLVSHGSAHTETSAQVLMEAADPRPANTPAAKTSDAQTQSDDPTQLLEVLPYDAAWLAKAQLGNEWLHPQESFHPNLPVILVAVKHDPQQKPALRVNGVAVDALKFDGTKLNADHSVALSTWRGVPVNEGDNKMELVISDAGGKEVSRTVRNIHYAATPDRVEFVPQLSHLVADGKTRPIIALRFLDKSGVPVRRGINGEFMLNEPYRSYDRREGIDREPLTGRVGGKARFEVQSDGVAMIELEPTTHSGETVLNFQFNDTRTQEVRTWLEAGQRDWILVGFGEGTLGQKTLSGNIQALQAADVDQQLFDKDKLAFYAKGSIRGDYLLTFAYDTAKQTGNPLLKQAVDPTQYYTLYADATQANFDAATSSRLYVKLERKQFYAMFGDYDTGLTVTELSRYSRSLNGIKSEYRGETVGYNVFATVTAQAYIKDEIPGNGTSGVYKLSRGNVVINSDKIRIETRDRFQSQNIISRQSLTRYLDYDIDYGTNTSPATLTFREPILTRDSNFNPTYIVAEYESADPADQKATLGGRGSFKPAKGVEVGATVVHEGTVGASGNLQGVDATYQLNDKTKVRAELATTNRNLAGIPVSGDALLGELIHHEEQWDAKAYLSEQTGGFGMGQQANSEIATRKFGVDGRFKLSDTAQLQGQTYQQSNLTSGAQNSVLEGRVDNRISAALSAYYGARTAQDTSAAGTTQSNQLLGGAAYTMPDKRLSLHSAAEIGGGSAGSVSMPNRLILGSDYKVTEQSTVFAEQEFARGEQIAANTTRIGIRTRPWTGNEMSASVGDNTHNDAERLYANLGMVQRWQINEHWQTNFSVDRSRTLYNTAAAPLNLNTPLPSGNMPLSTGEMSDYTSTAVGAAYHEKMWSCNGRIEIRNSTLNQQRNLQLGAQRNLDQGRTMAVGYTLRMVNNASGDTRNNDLRVSYAHRPNDNLWVWFDRADYITQSAQSPTSSLTGAKLVNNLNTNYMPSRHTQVSLQYGSKYVLDTIDGSDYKGYTDLIGAEIRHDLTQRWDIGMFGSVMRSLNAGVRDYGMGASVGYKVVDNMWLAVGYNVRGMNDRDFSNASYRARGPFITLRMKVDQDTFGLNKSGGILHPETIPTGTPE